jgi:hypothetical protein
LIYVVKYLFCSGFTIFCNEVLFDPHNEVVLEGTFNQLMENIGGQKFVNVCSQKIICEWLLMTDSKNKRQVCITQKLKERRKEVVEDGGQPNRSETTMAKTMA